MGNQELIVGSNEIAQIIKGKRTKRQRPMSPPPPPLALGVVVSSTTSLSSSPSCSSVEFAEEEDMANCLILLAQGSSNNNNQICKPPSEQETRAGNASKVYVYPCKKCYRCFPSFQALGGHRASHKKPKIAENNQDKKAISTERNQEHHDQDRFQFQEMNTTLSLQMANRVNLCGNNISMIKSNKIHECSICGAEFSSGQALGGHMRRHRAIVSNSTSANLKRSSPDYQSQEHCTKKSRNSLQLDLNLPAPQEDDPHEDAKLIRFTSPKEQALVFTATPNLIDCHY